MNTPYLEKNFNNSKNPNIQIFALRNIINQQIIIVIILSIIYYYIHFDLHFLISVVRSWKFILTLKKLFNNIILKNILWIKICSLHYLVFIVRLRNGRKGSLIRLSDNALMIILPNIRCKYDFSVITLHGTPDW